MPWLILVLIVATILQWFGQSRPGKALFERLRVSVSYRWGPFHQLLSGDALEPGEHPLYRQAAQAVSLSEGGHHTIVQRSSICLLTERRLLVCDARGKRLQIPLAGIRTARVYREFAPATGSTYWVAIDRAGSYAFARLGDIGLSCDSSRNAHDLASRIQEAIAHPAAM